MSSLHKTNEDSDSSSDSSSDVEDTGGSLQEDAILHYNAQVRLYELREKLEITKPSNSTELENFLATLGDLAAYNREHFVAIASAYENACDSQEEFRNGYLSLLGMIFLRASNFGHDENIEAVRHTFAEAITKFEHSVKFQTELLFLWASAEHKYAKSENIIEALFERIFAHPENREQEFYWLEQASMASGSIEKQREIYRTALSAPVRNPYAIEAAWRRAELLAEEPFMLTECAASCRRAIRAHEERRLQVRQRTAIKHAGAVGELPMPEDHACRIYLHNLPYALTEQELQHALCEHDELSVKLTGIQRKPNGRPTGVGYAQLESAEHVRKAIDLRAVYIKNRRVYISKEPNDVHTAGQPDAPADESEKRTAFIKGLPRDSTETEVREIFQEHGEIVGIRHFPRKQLAFVEFKDEQTAKAAVFNTVMNEVKLREHQLNIAISNPPPKRKHTVEADAPKFKISKRPRLTAALAPHRTAKKRLELIPTAVKRQVEAAAAKEEQHQDDA